MTMIAAASGAAPRIAGVVLNDVGPQLHQPGLDRIAGYVGGGQPVADLAAAAAAIRAINQPAFPKQEDPAFWRTFAERTFRRRPDGRYELDYDPGIASVFKGAPSPAPDLWPLWPALADIPTLIVRGALSDLITRETVAEMLRRKPDLITEEVDQVGHAPTLEEEVAWTAIWRFLARAP
jgi:pimeloyl-ACP methyl ester carboxylesterase